jgi:hexosaminidase
VGASTEVAGGQGGFYTQADYLTIVRYAATRYITVAPEIDMPGRTYAALAFYADLNCDGVAPRLYTGADVGFSSLCGQGVDVPVHRPGDRPACGAYPRPVPARRRRPGAVHHGGGLGDVLQPGVRDRGRSRQDRGRLARPGQCHATAVDRGAVLGHQHDQRGRRGGGGARHDAGSVVGNHAYLDKKYTEATPLGQEWAGVTDVTKAYGWDPSDCVKNVKESSLLGVEAPLWSETW